MKGNELSVLGVCLFAASLVLFAVFVLGTLANLKKKRIDPYQGCEVVSLEKTGKTRKAGVKVFYTEYETIKTYDCRGGGQEIAGSLG